MSFESSTCQQLALVVVRRVFANFEASSCKTAKARKPSPAYDSGAQNSLALNMLQIVSETCEPLVLLNVRRLDGTCLESEETEHFRQKMLFFQMQRFWHAQSTARDPLVMGYTSFEAGRETWFHPCCAAYIVTHIL